jgi:hypothetical protein
MRSSGRAPKGRALEGVEQRRVAAVLPPHGGEVRHCRAQLRVNRSGVRWNVALQLSEQK